MNDKPEIEVGKLPVITKFIYTLGVLPTSYLMSMTYQEQVTWLYNYLQTKVIPTIDGNAEAVKELQTLFELLRTYVHDYFNNLDVQEEINNKLDSLIEDGTLTELISVYLTPIITQQNNKINTNTNDINVLSSRMDAFTQLEDGSTSGDAELEDIRTGFNGTLYTTAGGAVRGEDTILNNRISNIEENMIKNNLFDNVLIQGLYSGTDGSFDGTRRDYVASKNVIDISNTFVYKFVEFPIDTLRVYVVLYDANMNFISASHIVNQAGATDPHIIPQTAYYMRLSFHKPNNAAINPNDIPYIKLYGNNSQINFIDSLKTSLAYKNINLYAFTNVYYTQGTGQITTAKTRLGIIQPVKFEKRTKIGVKSGYQYYYVKFDTDTLVKDQNTNVSHELSYSSTWLSNDTIFEAGDIITINIRKTSNTEITPSEAVNLIVEDVEETTLGGNYSIDSAFKKTSVSLQRLGRLTYPQSFLIYNGNYYSTDGTHISVQNSNFVEINNVELNVGHGNNFQLGHDGKAYISGWNDQKIYVIDLDTLTIDSTIVLPTTGYTTCGVDDINKLIYIFQTDTNNNSESNYNFIVYDYLNNIIKSSGKKTEKFGAIQGIDFIDGKIFVINGFGTSTIPNYYKIYNTIGDVIGEYKLQQTSTNEPEGIFVDRDTKDVYLGIFAYSQQDVYLVI